MALRQPRQEFGSQGDPGVLHAQRRRPSLPDQRFVGHLFAASQGVAQEADTQVGVFVLGADIPGQGVAGEKTEEHRIGVTGIGVRRIAHLHVGGKPRQPRALGCQIYQCYNLPVSLGNLVPGGRRAATGSSRPTSFRATISASRVPVKVLVIDPISKMLRSSSG